MTTPESPDLVALAERLETENGEGLYVLCNEAAAALRECHEQDEIHWKTRRAHVEELQSLRDQVAAYEPVIRGAMVGDNPKAQSCRYCANKWFKHERDCPVPAALAALPEKDDG